MAGVVGSPVHQAAVLGLRADLPALEHVWSLDGGGVAEAAAYELDCRAGVSAQRAPRSA